jgi:hypothetical protein
MSSSRDTSGTPIHPFCNKCGWRMGGVDSWDGHRCKCGNSALPFAYRREEPATVTPIAKEPV